MSKATPANLQQILEQLRDGAISTHEAQQQIRNLQAQSLGFATIDHERRERCGIAEVIYAAGKTPEHLVAITHAVLEREPACLITRAGEQHIAALRGSVNGHPLCIGERCGTVLVGTPEAHDVPAIPIVTAGTSDLAVAEEAALTCEALGHPVHAINDVGVAGLHRLTARLGELRAANVIICIAGMEGALPSVLGGLVDVPVIAVPTSVGYGAAFEGMAALLGMLTSCAAGVSVVNIDNGFGAAYSACLINRAAAGLRRPAPEGGQ